MPLDLVHNDSGESSEEDDDPWETWTPNLMRLRTLSSTNPMENPVENPLPQLQSSCCEPIIETTSAMSENEQPIPKLQIQIDQKEFPVESQKKKRNKSASRQMFAKMVNSPESECDLIDSSAFAQVLESRHVKKVKGRIKSLGGSNTQMKVSVPKSTTSPAISGSPSPKDVDSLPLTPSFCRVFLIFAHATRHVNYWTETRHVSFSKNQ